MVPDVSKDHSADTEPLGVCGPLDLDLECQVRSDRSKRREPTTQLRFKRPVRRLEMCVPSVSVPRLSSIFFFFENFPSFGVRDVTRDKIIS